MSDRNQDQKKDAGKPPMELLSPAALVGTSQVLAYGAKKYAAHGWRRGIEWSRLIGACMRHLVAFMGGEDLDQETGLPHVDHLACEVMFLQEHYRARRDLDDRYKAPVARGAWTAGDPIATGTCTWETPCESCAIAKADILKRDPNCDGRNWLRHAIADTVRGLDSLPVPANKAGLAFQE